MFLRLLGVWGGDGGVEGVVEGVLGWQCVGRVIFGFPGTTVLLVLGAVLAAFDGILVETAQPLQVLRLELQLLLHRMGLPVLGLPLLQLQVAERSFLAAVPQLPGLEGGRGGERLGFGLLLAFVGEDAEVEFETVVLEGVGAEHGEEVEPLGVEDGVVEVLPQDQLVEAVEVASCLQGHNDVIN